MDWAKMKSHKRDIHLYIEGSISNDLHWRTCCGSPRRGCQFASGCFPQVTEKLRFCHSTPGSRHSILIVNVLHITRTPLETLLGCTIREKQDIETASRTCPKKSILSFCERGNFRILEESQNSKTRRQLIQTPLLGKMARKKVIINALNYVDAAFARGLVRRGEEEEREEEATKKNSCKS